MTPGQRAFQIHAAVWTGVNTLLFVIWLLFSAPRAPWFLIPAAAMAIPLAIHAAVLYTKAPGDDELDAGDEHPQLGYRS